MFTEILMCSKLELLEVGWITETLCSLATSTDGFTAQCTDKSSPWVKEVWPERHGLCGHDLVPGSSSSASLLRDAVD